MEYLMTYGWAILIIAVILGILFQLGVFSSGTLTGTACIATSGYYCSNPTLTTGGTLTFIFGQSTGSTLYNLEIACTDAGNTLGPYPITSFNSITGTGLAIVASSTGNQLNSGQSIVVSALPCYTSSGVFIGSRPVGYAYSGYIWVNYTQYATPAGAGNPWQTVKSSAITVKVS